MTYLDLCPRMTIAAPAQVASARGAFGAFPSRAKQRRAIVEDDLELTLAKSTTATATTASKRSESNRVPSIIRRLIQEPSPSSRQAKQCACSSVAASDRHPPSSMSANLDDTAQQQQHADRSPSDQRKPSLPSISTVHSPEQHHVSLPQYTPPPNRSSPPQAQDAIQALTKLSASNAPPPTQWGDHRAPENVQRRESQSHDRRPGSAHSATFELPPPPLDAQRKMSSPTLDQYHVASRSPEQRKASLVSPGSAAITLPPLQNVTSLDGQMRRPSVASTHDASPTSARATTQLTPGSMANLAENDKESAHADPSASQAPVPSLVEPSFGVTEQADDMSPAHIKQENLAVPQPASPIDARRPSLQTSDMEPSKAISSLKRENSARLQSPLRESSVPMPSTEAVHAESAVSRKRPLPKKKGQATTMKKAPPLKKRKLESTRSDTPSSRMSRPAFKTGSSKGTPVGSSPAPSDRSGSVDPDDEEEEEEEGTPVSDDLYCLCRRPDTGTFMIGCDGQCDDWFHGKCVGIEERDKNLIDKFMCPRCTEAGIGRTTWKRICRRSGCRLPARVGKNKHGSDGSKYCSDECGVTFFRQMTAAARGSEQAGKSRSTRRKTHHITSESQASNDLGARGGVLAPAEVRALLDSSQSLDEFKKLGEGVLSPPATPDGKNNGGDKHRGEYTELETQTLADITAKKDASRIRHQLLKDRQLFINMTKQAASRACAESDLKPKEYCGFDPRLEWSEEQFAIWRASPVGEQAFALGTLAIEKSGDEPMVDEGDDNEGVFATVQMCEKKKCARHLEWVKLATDDVRFEMSDNSDCMRGLDREEREIRERAVLRVRSGGELQGEGSVEVHGLGLQAAVDDHVEKNQGTIAAPLLPAPESVVPVQPPSEAMQIDTDA
jgi:COMPASS component SPP1